MIKLNKLPEPQILAANKANWTTSLINLINQGAAIPDSLYTKYNHDDVKDSLRKECFSKCMYCESKVEHITDIHIEHIRPKARAKYPNLTFEYANLGLACPLCNRNKSDTFDQNTPFINPYADDPSSFFYAWGVFLWPKNDNPRARLTELELDLNRKDLLEARTERIKMIKGLIDTYKKEPDPSIQQALKKQIMREVSDEKVYSFFCRKLVESELT